MNQLWLSVYSRLRPSGRSHQLASSCHKHVTTRELNREVESSYQKHVPSQELSRRRASSYQRYASTSAFSRQGASSCQRYDSTSALIRQGASSCQRNVSASELNCRVWWGPSTSFLRPSSPAIISEGVRGCHSVAHMWGQKPLLREFSEIPGPKSWPIFGNSIQLLQRKGVDDTPIHKVFESLFKEYGPIIKLNIPGMPTTVATKNPKDIETFMRTNLEVPTRDFFPSLKSIRDNAPNTYFKKKRGLLCENGKEWHRLRCRLQGPLTKPSSVASYLPQVDKTTKAYMERIDSLQAKTGRVPNSFLDDMYLWALECLCHISMDRELGCLEPGLSPSSAPMQMVRHVKDVMAAMYDLEMGPRTWRLYKTKSYVKMETAHSALLEIAVRTIEEASERLAESKDDPHRKLSMLETLLTTHGLSKTDVVTFIMDLFFAGMETTAHSLAFTLYHLAKNPEAQKKLQEEVDTVLGDATDLLPEHLNNMTYLSYVVKESLRIHPGTPCTARNLEYSIIMSGYKVPAGTLAMGANLLLCQDKQYFRRPKEFLPERWAPDRPLGHIHPFASLPFSYGTRMCIGKKIAEQEIYTFLIRVMQKYSITFESPREMEIETLPFVKPIIALAFKFHHRK